MKYRSDIDGLRALAILPVLFFHAGFEVFSGGFVGVDIFFVISGYLITNIIWIEIQENRFSFINFYERRARRILPALFAVIACSLVVAWFLMMPDRFDSMAKSAFSALFSASNVYFWRQAGYFANASDLLPLLHTWSLGVEEQFYIGLPILMVVLYKLRPPMVLIGVIAVVAASFLLSVWATGRYPSANFYLIPTRMWELGVGSLLALLMKKNNTSLLVRNSIGLLGISLILYSIFYYTKKTPFPGLSALLPCLGSAAIIWAGFTQINAQKSIVTKVLSTPALVFTGKISYSVYLWHFPLIVFTKHYLITKDLEIEISVLLVVLSFFLGWASWYFIETPFRNKLTFSRRYIFKYSGIITTMLAVVTSSIFLLKGIPSRVPTEAIQITQGQTNFSKIGLDCIAKTKHSSTAINITECHLGEKSKSPQFIVWGDSHAGAILPAFNQAAKAQNISGFAIASDTCPAFQKYSSAILTFPTRANCSDRNVRVLDYLAETESIKQVFLVGYWKAYGRLERAWSKEEGLLHSTIEEINQIYIKSLRETIVGLKKQQKEVYVLLGLPEATGNDPWALALHKMRSIQPKPLLPNQKSIFEIELEKIMISEGVNIINLGDLLCKSGICISEVGGNTIYRDGNHLSAFGAVHIAKTAINQALAIKN